ncbi:MAG TPA: hypothetical protein VLH56_04710 [Dissulfurispiraceae bacterium]|nr:hypothetical protein [Dissulfurispiraceae bacterium]
MENTGRPDQIHYQKLFMGTILASFTHELRNRLAVVQEVSGLQQDIIAVDRTVRDLSGLVRTLRSVDEHVGNALRLISVLSRFAHRLDTEMSFFRVQEVLEELIELVKRSADEKRVGLETDFDPALPPVSGDPARLQMLVFFLLDESLCSLEQGGSVLVRITEHAPGIMIRIIPRGPRHTGGGSGGRCPRDILLSVAGDIGAEVSTGGVEQETGVLLRRREHIP